MEKLVTQSCCIVLPQKGEDLSPPPLLLQPRRNERTGVQQVAVDTKKFLVVRVIREFHCFEKRINPSFSSQTVCIVGALNHHLSIDDSTLSALCSRYQKGYEERYWNLLMIDLSMKWGEDNDISSFRAVIYVVKRWYLRFFPVFHCPRSLQEWSVWRQRVGCPPVLNSQC